MKSLKPKFFTYPAVVLLGALSIASPSEAMFTKKTVITVEEFGPSNTPPKNPFGVSELSSQDKNITTQNILGRYRVQLFSIDQSEGAAKAHTKFETMRSKDNRIVYYPAIIAAEQGSKWLRGQIGPFANFQEATEVATALRQVFTADLPCVSEPGIVHQKGFQLKSIEKHNWS